MWSKRTGRTRGNGLAASGNPSAGSGLEPVETAANNDRQKPRLIRYADDLVILCRPGQGQGMKERLARWLKRRGLALNEQKTRVVPSRTGGFTFLGFSFRWQKSQRGTPYFRTEPSPAAEPFRQAQGPEPAEGQALRDAVREITPSFKTWRSPQEVVREINQVTRGWGNYFALAHYHRSFGQMNSLIAHRLRQWLWRKHGHPPGKDERWTPEVLQETYGLQLLPTCWRK
jgi:hypothetical protein